MDFFKKIFSISKTLSLVAIIVLVNSGSRLSCSGLAFALEMEAAQQRHGQEDDRWQNLGGLGAYPDEYFDEYRARASSIPRLRSDVTMRPDDLNILPVSASRGGNPLGGSCCSLDDCDPVVPEHLRGILGSSARTAPAQSTPSIPTISSVQAQSRPSTPRDSSAQHASIVSPDDHTPASTIIAQSSATDSPAAKSKGCCPCVCFYGVVIYRAASR